VLFYGRLGTIRRSGPGGRIIWIEVTDDGGRTRLFSSFATDNVKRLGLITYELLDELVAATAAPLSIHGRAARRAELFFADPQVGDVFYTHDDVSYLEVLELGAGGSIRVLTKTCETGPLNCRTDSIYFASAALFQQKYEFKARPGYSMLAFSSQRSDEAVRRKMPVFLGEWQQPAKVGADQICKVSDRS